MGPSLRESMVAICILAVLIIFLFAFSVCTSKFTGDYFHDRLACMLSASTFSAILWQIIGVLVLAAMLTGVLWLFTAGFSKTKGKNR